MVAVLVSPGIDAWKARDHMGPYQVDPEVRQAIDWLGEPGPGGEVQARGSMYSVGLWNWHSFLIPLLAERNLVDGWHDEGAHNVAQIRELRIMGWTGRVDVRRAHGILVNLGATEVLVNRGAQFPIDSPEVFWEQLEGFQRGSRKWLNGETWPCSGYCANALPAREYRTPPP